MHYVVVPFPNMIAALKAHQVSAISAVEPFLTGAEASDGAKEVVSSCDGPVADMPMSGYFATSGGPSRTRTRPVPSRPRC